VDRYVTIPHMASTPREPILRLNNPELEWKRFERFCLDLARALPDVADAHLYGTRGENQQGIDIHCDLVDGRVRTIQCRRVAKFGKGDAETTIAETTYDADEHLIWATCPLSIHARKVVRETAAWEAQDLEQISSELRGLPREQARWIVEDHLGDEERRRLLGPESDLCVIPASASFARLDQRKGSLGTAQQLRGRESELSELQDALADPQIRVIVLVGRGGIGKTRLLRALVDGSPERRMLLLLEGVDALGGILDELPLDPFDFVVDDAHRREDLLAVLNTVLRRQGLDKIVLGARPQGRAALRADIAALGIASDAVCEVGPLGALGQQAALALAAEELGPEHAQLAKPLARLTRDAPALCVLGARLLRKGELAPAALATDATVHQDILARFREEAIGRVDDRVDPALVAHLLPLIAALQPLDTSAEGVLAWLGEQVGTSIEEVRAAVCALEDADLLVGSGRRRRLVPDILADRLLHEACVDREGHPTGRAEELFLATPEGMASRLLLNLAELDWRLGLSNETRVLDALCTRLKAELLAADAWQRERLLELIGDSAVYLAPWIVEIARELLDHPARDSTLLRDMKITDTDARRHLVPLLRSAAFDPQCTAPALRLLWETGADLPPRRALGEEGDALEAIRKLGDYRFATGYGEALLDLVEELLADPAQAESRRALPVSLLSALTAREGTTSRARGYEVHLGSFYVDARATVGLRTRLRAFLVRECSEGGPRTRVASAEILGGMLRQPHGFYGQTVPREVVSQWRDEQIGLLADIEGVFAANTDPLVARRLRDELGWHAEHSAIRGVKTRARAILRANPPQAAERLARALTHTLAEFANRKTLSLQRRKLAKELLVDTDGPEELLGRIEEMMEGLAVCEPELGIDCGALLVVLAELDPDWALAASALLSTSPNRPTAAGVGVLLTAVLQRRPEQARAILAGLADGDISLRRLAADHVSRMAWWNDPVAPERELAVRLAGDEDMGVARGAVLVALRCAGDDPGLARRIVLAVRDIANQQLAEEVCMAITHIPDLSSDDWALLCDRLLACPVVEYWYEKALGLLAGADARLAVDHLLERCDERPDNWDYQPLPHDGLGADLLAEAPELRREALGEIARRLAEDRSGRRSFCLPTLFWSLGGGGEEPAEIIAEGLASGGPPHEAAEALISAARGGWILGRPQWVAERLEASSGGEALDGLQGALHGALRSGIRQGTPGEPFPQDVALAKQARELAAESPAGSRTAVFWSRIAKAVEADMRKQVQRDADWIEEN